MKDQNTALSPTQPYFIATNDTWTPGSQPATQPPPQPGYIQIFGNPIRSQTITQPVGTKFTWFGLVDFTGATVIGLGNSVGSNLSVNSGTTIATPNLVNTTGASGSLAIFTVMKDQNTALSPTQPYF